MGEVMSDELRDRMSRVIYRAEKEWWDDEHASLSSSEYVAQAVVDDLGLTVEKSPIVSGAFRVVGGWKQS